MVGLFLSAATRAGPASWWDDGRGGPKSTGSRRRIDDIDDGDGPLAVRRRAHTSRDRRRRRSASAASGPCPPSAWREVATVGEGATGAFRASRDGSPTAVVSDPLPR